MLIAEYDYELDIQVQREEAEEDGREKGRAEGRAETLFQLYDRGLLTLEQASEQLESKEDRFLSEFEDWKRKRVSAERQKFEK